MVQQNPGWYRRLLAATRKGYQQCARWPHKAASLLLPLVAPADRDHDFLLESLEYTAPHYGAGSTWGHMKPAPVAAWLQWLHRQGLETTPVETEALYTNTLLSSQESAITG